MPKPYIQVFYLAGMGEIASVVMDQEDFDEVCENISGIIEVQSKERMAEDQIAAIRAARMIPAVKRGTKTEFLFDKFDVEQDLMCLCVRGHGERTLQQIKNRDQGLMN